MFPFASTLWIRTGLAIGAIAVLPFVNLVAIDELDRLHRQSPATLTAPLTAFAFDPATTPPAGSARIAGTTMSTASSGSGGHAKAEMPRAPVPTPSPVIQTTTAQVLAVPLSYWVSQRMMLSFVGSLVLMALAIAAIIGIAREARRRVQLDVPLVAATRDAAGDHAEVQRFAEQVRSDARDAVHAMRTPLSIVIGYTASLRRRLPAGDPRVARALDAIELSASNLGDSIDEAWDKASSLQAFAEAPREPVDLSEVLSSALDSRIAVPRVTPWPVHRNVLAPRAWLEDMIQDVVDAFETDAPDGDLALAFHEDDATIGFVLEIKGDGDGHPVEPLCLKSWPSLVDARRTINLLGGRMTVMAATVDRDRLRKVLVALPCVGKVA